MQVQPTSARPTRAPRRMLERRRRALRAALVGTVGLALLVGLAFGVLQWRLVGNLTTASVGEHVVEEETETGALNVLFIGSDSRDLRSAKHGRADGSRRLRRGRACWRNSSQFLIIIVRIRAPGALAPAASPALGPSNIRLLSFQCSCMGVGLRCLFLLCVL